MSLVDFRYSTPLVIPNASDAADRITSQEITYIFNALKTLALQLDKVTGALSPVPDTWSTIVPASSLILGNMSKFYAYCATTIGYGAFVNFYNKDATHVQAKPAKADNFANAAAGFCNTPGGFAAGSFGEFITGPGLNTGISGMTPGNWYFLDPTTATGQVTATAPSTAGQIYQCCGIALTDKTLLVGGLNNWLVI